MKKRERKIWENVLPITMLVVVFGLGFALYWFSPAHQEQLRYTMRQAEPTPTRSYSEWMDYFGLELGNTPNPYPQSFYLEPGEHTLYFRGREPEALLDKVKIVPVWEVTATAAAWTPTPYPLCTAVPCASNRWDCPDDSGCLGGCGMVCVEDTPTPTPVPREVRVTGDYVSDQRGLNVRRGDPSLYGTRTAFFIPPDCSYKPEYLWCIEEPVIVLDMVYVDPPASRWHDRGWWGQILCRDFCDDQYKYFIPLFLERYGGQYFTDLRSFK